MSYELTQEGPPGAQGTPLKQTSTPWHSPTDSVFSVAPTLFSILSAPATWRLPRHFDSHSRRSPVSPPAAFHAGLSVCTRRIAAVHGTASQVRCECKYAREHLVLCRGFSAQTWCHRTCTYYLQLPGGGLCSRGRGRFPLFRLFRTIFLNGRIDVISQRVVLSRRGTV